MAQVVVAHLSVRRSELQRFLEGFPAVWKKVSGEDFRLQVFAVIASL